MTPELQAILDHHQQLRVASCFQMGPELALKFAGILKKDDYPYQNEPKWDGRGFAPYYTDFENSEWVVTWECVNTQFIYPYVGLMKRLKEEVGKGFYPVVSLLPPNKHDWHGYVVVETVGTDDFRVVTKKGSLQMPPCISEVDLLSSRVANREKVDCLFWRATRKPPQSSLPTA